MSMWQNTARGKSIFFIRWMAVVWMGSVMKAALDDIDRVPLDFVDEPMLVVDAA